MLETSNKEDLKSLLQNNIIQNIYRNAAYYRIKWLIGFE